MITSVAAKWMPGLFLQRTPRWQKIVSGRALEARKHKPITYPISVVGSTREQGPGQAIRRIRVERGGPGDPLEVWLQKTLICSSSVDVKKALFSRGRSFVLKAAFSSREGFVVIFGPSGAGKTLTLQSIAGLITPDSGRIVLEGQGALRFKERDQYTSAAPQYRLRFSGLRSFPSSYGF